MARGFPDSFIQISKGYFLNMDYVEKYDPGSMTVTYSVGGTANIPQKRRKEFSFALNEYFGDRRSR